VLRSGEGGTPDDDERPAASVDLPAADQPVKHVPITQEAQQLAHLHDDLHVGQLRDHGRELAHRRVEVLLRHLPEVIVCLALDLPGQEPQVEAPTLVA